MRGWILLLLTLLAMAIGALAMAVLGSWGDLLLMLSVGAAIGGGYVSLRAIRRAHA